MWAYHDSRNRLYRTPFGAAAIGSTVQMSIDVGGDPGASVVLRTWIDGAGEQFVPMVPEPKGDFQRFTCSYNCNTPAIVWYMFLIERSDGRILYYGTRNGATGGEGELGPDQPSSYQLTVYAPRKVKPDWFTKGVVYQIFPDRFCRGEGWEVRAQEALGLHEGDSADGVKGVARRIVSDWNVEPRYERDEQGRVVAWDFYGGTLEGIESKLDYLADAGFSVLYLNPIFEARSNHRYDTADFLQIDTMLGTEQDFTHLCEEAKKRGISVVLDGVFNHVGSDSRYFNRFNTYEEPGAWQAHEAKLRKDTHETQPGDEEALRSPYFDWFTFNDDGTYEAWWGVDDLPDITEENPDYQKLICGQEGVVRHWLRAGASGWRLDVADELPDSFIAKIKEAALAEKDNALVLGEVWEDASNKISYGELRRYLLGNELDSAMNYPFRTAVLDFLLGKISAADAANSLMNLVENYPPEAQDAALNLLSSHDRPRLMSVLGGALDHPEWESWPDDFPGRLRPDQRGLAKARFWLAVLMQMTYRGVPSVYYGDELGLEGLSDPYNRGSYPWGAGDKDCATMYRNAIMLRKSLPILTNGTVRPINSGDDVLGWWRLPSGAELADGAVGEGPGASGRCAVPGLSVCVLVNRSLSDSRNVSIPSRGSRATEIISGLELRRDGESVSLTLPPLGSAIVVFEDIEALAKPLERGCGVVCHITSVPNGGKPGTLGKPAHDFVDWLVGAKQTYWQILPVNPTDSFNSPYAGSSVFAGNERLLEQDESELRASFDQFEPDAVFKEYVLINEDWLYPYAAFAAISTITGTDNWRAWPSEWQHYSAALADDERLQSEFRFHLFCQWQFQRQWESLRLYANERGIKIIGDIPMYPAANSADVWANPDLFCLDANNNVALQAGAPPDQMSKDGQTWGNPCYRWGDSPETVEKIYAWWMIRFARTFGLYDVVRLDHFLGFQNFFGIPQDGTAADGAWHAGPGIELFRLAHYFFGKLPILAEDLGSITPAIRALLSQVGCCGMDVMQFADNDVRYGWHPLPTKVAYSSTHDTATLVGWCAERFGLNPDDVRTLAQQLMAEMYKNDARLHMCTLQDAMLLDNSARMNVPGVADGNWSWHADEVLLPQAQEYLLGLIDGSTSAF